MATWTLTQVGSAVINLVENVPTSISGALPDLANMSMKYVETYTGQSIGSLAIPEQYQGPILYLTIAKTARLMSVVGTDKGFSLGDLSVEARGGVTVTDTLADSYEKMAKDELTRLGTFTRYGRTY